MTELASPVCGKVMAQLCRTTWGVNPFSEQGGTLLAGVAAPAARGGGLASVRDAVVRCQSHVGSRGAGVLGRRLRGWRLGQRVLRTRALHFDLGRSRIA